MWVPGMGAGHERTGLGAGKKNRPRGPGGAPNIGAWYACRRLNFGSGGPERVWGVCVAVDIST